MFTENFKMVISFTTLIAVLLSIRIIFFNEGISHNIAVKLGLEETTISVQSVSVDDGITGCFTLGTGNIENTAYYYVYEIQPDGGKKLKSYEANRVTIYDTLKDDEEPYLDASNWFNIKMYLPENTVEKEYNINTGDIIK